MKKGWNEGRLSSFVTEFIVPQRDKPKKFDGNIPWCRIEDFNGVYLSDTKSNQYVSQETIIEMGLKVYPVNTVIVSCSADLGRCAIIERPLITNQTFIGLVPGQDLDPKFLYYFMGSVARMLNEMATGATIKYLSKKKFQDLNCCFPPLNEQKRIVVLLDKCFQFIDRAKTIAEKNLQNAKELFESYLNEVFENKGEGWETKKLGDVIEIRNGKNQQAVLSQLGQYPILGSGGNVMGFATDYICEAGTTIIGRKGNISKPIFVGEKFWNVDTAFGLYPIGSLPEKFVYYTCLNIDFGRLNRGTTIPSLVKTELLQIPIRIPKSLKTQQAIVQKLEALNAETKKVQVVYQNKLSDLEELKKSILQKAFCGELNTEITS